MQKEKYPMDYQVQVVQELVDTIGDGSKVTAENYKRKFVTIVQEMVEAFVFDVTKKGEKVENEKFADFIDNEFLTQYCQVLDMDINQYRGAWRSTVLPNMEEKKKWVESLYSLNGRCEEIIEWCKNKYGSRWDEVKQQHRSLLESHHETNGTPNLLASAIDLCQGQSHARILVYVGASF